MKRGHGTGCVYLPKGSSKPRIKYYAGGARHDEGGFATIKEARAALAQRLADAGKGIPVTARTGRITLREMMDGVLTKMRLDGRIGHDGDAKGRIERHVLKPEGFFDPDRRASSVMTADLERLAERLLAKGAARASVNHVLALIRRGFRLALRGGELASIPHVPMLSLTGKHTNVRTGFFERASFEATRAALPDHLKGLVTFGYFTGWRVGEIRPLSWAQVDREAQVVRLEVGSTKNGEGRTLPYGLLPDIVEVVEAAWAERERLAKAGVICPFVFNRGGAEIRDFRVAWATATEAAGCPGRRFHDLRRTAARNLVRAGVPEKIAMGVTGHKTRSMFDRYDIVDGRDVANALGALAAAPAAPGGGKGEVRAFRRA